MKTAVLRWLGHIKRMTENRLPKKLNEWMSKGRRKREEQTFDTGYSANNEKTRIGGRGLGRWM